MMFHIVCLINDFSYFFIRFGKGQKIGEHDLEKKLNYSVFLKPVINRKIKAKMRYKIILKPGVKYNQEVFRHSRHED